MKYVWEDIQHQYARTWPSSTFPLPSSRLLLHTFQGMALGYGGNPYGPAGTGKTESVKALGQAMARQVRNAYHPLHTEP